MAGLLMPLASSSQQLPMPAADEALTTFLVAQLGAPLDLTTSVEGHEPALVVHLGPASAPRSQARRIGPAVLAAAAAVAVVTAVGAAAITGVGQRDEAPVVVTPVVQTPTPMPPDGATDDPVAHTQATPAAGDGAAVPHRSKHGSTGGPAGGVVGPGAAASTGTDHHGATAAPSTAPTVQATGDDDGDPGDDGSGDGSGGRSDDDGTSVGTSGAGDDATPTPSATGEAGDGADR